MTTKIFFKNVSFAVVGAAATIFIAVKPVSANDRLTVVTWGGAYTKSQVLAYFRPYRARTGVRFNIEDYNGGLAQIEAQVDSLNIKWDVVDLTLSDAIRGCEQGLLEEFDHSILPPAPDGIPAGEDFLEGTLTRCGVGEILWSTVIAYDATKFADEKPFSITDFWDIKKFPGKRAMRKVPQKNLEWALIADGVPTGEVYE
ncbi:MAG: extracellular solute-binding protein, partial [Alphaproteobacteria bacterium]